VEDHGAGPPPDAGQPFRSSKPRSTLAGLGLFVARAVLEAHGGTLLLEARPGGGTRAALVVRTAPAG
jgi:signal transduction histidine kinase